MGEISRAQLAAQLQARSRASRSKTFSLEELFFPPQLRLSRSKAKRKVARLPRRSGKTTSTAGILLEGAITPPYANQGYVTTSLKNAKRLVWPTLKRWNDEYALGGVPNDTDGSMKFPDLPNQPNIYLGGMKDRNEIEKIRGWEGGAKRFVVDEAQSARTSLLQELIDDAIEPSLFDYDGELIISGTPGPVRSGYFFDIDEGSKRAGWEHHFWTIHENPWLQKKSGKSPAQILTELRERRGWTEEHPSYVREYLGQWVSDSNALVFKYLRERNHFDVLPDGKFTHVMGVDLGFEDADAIAIEGWQSHKPDVYLIEERVDKKAGITELVDRMRPLYEKYRPIKVVMDFGGLGKKIGEEITRRYGIPVEAAEKARKFEHIELLNDALRTGRFHARQDGNFAEDCELVQWDTDDLAEGKRTIADDYHSDITDAALYAFRACYGYLSRPPRPAPADENQALLRRLMLEQRRGARDPLAAALGFDD